MMARWTELDRDLHDAVRRRDYRAFRSVLRLRRRQFAQLRRQLEGGPTSDPALRRKLEELVTSWQGLLAELGGWREHLKHRMAQAAATRRRGNRLQRLYNAPRVARGRNVRIRAT